MNLSEKLIRLRKSSGMTQEELAEICDVSRQSDFFKHSSG